MTITSSWQGRLLPACAFIAATVASTAGQQAEPTPRQTIRSSVDVVTIQASVRDRRGRPMKGLTPGDFEVRDNGQLRPILSLRPDDGSALSLAFLVDSSGSMAVEPKLEMTRHAVEGVLAQLREGLDEAAVFTFDSSLHERQDFTGDRRLLLAAIHRLEPFGSTSLYDATASAARRLAGRSGARKAIILLTDGVDTSSELTAAEASGVASSIDVPVYVVATLPSIDQRQMLERTVRTELSRPDLRDLAGWTGGRVLFASSFEESVMAASSLVAELRQQYVLAIAAADRREWRRLEVRVKQSSATVRARSGYFGG